MIRDWYNGYRWGGQDVTSVYNPFDVLLLLQEQRFGAYWFETATPTFLIDILKERGIFTPCRACPTVVLRIQVRSFAYVANLSSLGPTWGIRDGPRGYSVYLENGSLASLTGKAFEYLSVVQVD